MDRKEQYMPKSRLQEIVPSTRFGQGLFNFIKEKKNIIFIIFSLGLASLFYLKRHKKRDDHGRAPVVSRLRAQSTLQIITSPSCNTMPFEVLTPMKTSSTPPPPTTTTTVQIASLK